jgi:hypothetical protein
MTSAGDLWQKPGNFLTARHERLTCVIKTNPGEHFSVMRMISTMISLDAYETLTRRERGSRTAGN